MLSIVTAPNNERIDKQTKNIAVTISTGSLVNLTANKAKIIHNIYNTFFISLKFKYRID